MSLLTQSSGLSHLSRHYFTSVSSAQKATVVLFSLKSTPGNTADANEGRERRGRGTSDAEYVRNRNERRKGEWRKLRCRSPRRRSGRSRRDIYRSRLKQLLERAGQSRGPTTGLRTSASRGRLSPFGGLPGAAVRARMRPRLRGPTPMRCRACRGRHLRPSRTPRAGCRRRSGG